MTMKLNGLMLTLALGLTFTGCDSEPLGPSAEGEVWVGATAGGSADGPARSLAATGEGEATISVTARVDVWTDADGWVELTDRAETRALALGGAEATTVTTARLRSGTYKRVRIRFEEVRASGTGGTTVEAGIGGADVRVDIAANSAAIVERDVEIRIRADAGSRLTMNLNADAWLAQASGGLVSESAFASAVQVSAE
ncbi:MAG: hypothetical protein WD766_02100 [Gemmatimonadota bacterium]